MIKVGKGRSEVTITGALADDLERELRGLLGPVADEMQYEADRILRDEVLPNWPVKTGKSRDGWETSLRVQPGALVVEVVIFNTHAYTRYVKSTKVGDKQDATRLRTPFQEHVRKPVRAAERVLAARLVDELAQHLQGVFSGR